MVKRTIEVVIKSKDEASASIDSITTGALRRLGEEAIMLAKRLPAAAFELVKLGATAERQEAALNNLAASFGTSGAEIIKAMQKASNFTIDRMSAMSAANKAMILGVAKTPAEFARITETAVALGRAMGQDAVKSIDDFVTAAGRQSVMIADNLGLLIKQEDLQADVNRIMARNPGITEKAAKSQAFLNAMLTAGEEKMGRLGDTTEDTATRLEQATASFNDLKVGIAESIIESEKMGQVLLDIDWRLAQKELKRTQDELVKLGVITAEDVKQTNKQLQSITGLIATVREQEEQTAAITAELERLNAERARHIQLIEFDRQAAESLGISTGRVVAATEEMTNATDEAASALEAEKLFLQDLNTAFREFAEIEGAARLEQQQIAEAARAAADPLIAEKQFMDDLTNSFYEFAAIEGAAKMAEVAEAERQAAEDTEKLAEEMKRLAEEAEEAAAITGDEFVVAAGDATDETENWAIALFEAADAAGADANELAILAGALGIYTDDQIAAALATVALTTTIDQLGEAIADGSITIEEAIATVQESIAALEIDIDLTERSTRATKRQSSSRRDNSRATRDAARAERDLARAQAMTGDFFADAIDNMEFATETTDAWAVALFKAADAAGADANELALLAGALGLYTEEQVQAALAAAALEEKIRDIGRRIAEGLGINKAIQEFNRFRDSLQLPEWLEPGSATPLELGLFGIADAMRQVSGVELPRLAMSLQGAGGANRQTVNNFNLTISSVAPSGDAIQDFQTLQSMAG